jgi:hypothetical protein
MMPIHNFYYRLASAIDGASTISIFHASNYSQKDIKRWNFLLINRAIFLSIIFEDAISGELFDRQLGRVSLFLMVIALMTFGAYLSISNISEVLSCMTIGLAGAFWSGSLIYGGRAASALRSLAIQLQSDTSCRFIN